MRIDELRKRLLEERNRSASNVAKAQEDAGEPESVASAPESPEWSDGTGEQHEHAEQTGIEQHDHAEAPLPVEQSAAGASGAVPMPPLDQPSVAGAVAQSFERTKSFENRFAKLMSTFEQADKLAQEAIEALGQLRELADHLPSLVKAFEPMKAVQRQLAELSHVFEPMKPAEKQIVEFSQTFSRAFNENLARIAQMLEPVRDFQGRLAQLASDFSPANDLQKRFESLAHSFQEELAPATSAHETAAAEEQQEEHQANGLAGVQNGAIGS